MKETEELYITTTSGDMILVQIYESDNDITLVLGDQRYDLSLGSACELTETMWSVISEVVNP
jgi:hypothetical protein